MTALAAFEEIIDISGVAPRIEALLPIGVRPRQLKIRTLLAGMCLAQADHRPAPLTKVHQALTSLPRGEQRRLGGIAGWNHGPHHPTHPQSERAFRPGAPGPAPGEAAAPRSRHAGMTRSARSSPC